MLVVDFEDWALMKVGALRLTREELNNLPVSTVQRYIGFETGFNELKKQEQQKAQKQSQFNGFRRGNH